MMKAQEVEPENPFAESEVWFGELIGKLQSAKVQSMSHAEVEDLLDEDGTELLRRMFQGHLDARGPGDVGPKVVGSDGVVRTHRRLLSRPLMTVFGQVTVRRFGYGAPGVESLFPLDAELNLPREKFSHGVRRRVAQSSAKESFDEVVGDVAETTGAHVAKRQAEELAACAAVDFDDFYTERERAAAAAESTGSVLAMSVDEKGVVMRHEDLRPATQEAAASRSHKLSKRLSPGEKHNAKRMSAVGAVYTVEPFIRKPDDIVRELHGEPGAENLEETPRPKPEHKRVWASLEKPLGSVIEEAFQEAVKRDADRSKTWVGLVDGNRRQIKALRAAAARHRVALTIVLDLIHVIEYLWRAAWALHTKAQAEQAQYWVTERLRWILEGKSSTVAAGMRRSATRRGIATSSRKPLDDCARYLINNRPYLRYHEYLAAGLPISTGVIEGACRHLVKDRMDLTGARWSLRGAEPILRLRSLRASRDFDDYWRFHTARERASNHDLFYENNQPPIIPRTDPAAASGPTLRLLRGGKAAST